ncbi:MAG: c-type cytochrome [Saprospiraceae bacterium]|nr:c-type cytochrome [Saprospiraceae bacterium]
MSIFVAQFRFNPDMKAIFLKIFVVLFLTALACTHDGYDPIDHELKQLIRDPQSFILPSSTEYDKIPQSPLNPLTPEKIALGKLLFFEPAFANEAKNHALLNTFTCSSCHVVESGFRPGRMQGIADGGYGFGVKGEKRIKHPFYSPDSIDAQGARPLATINVAFVENTMWNGSFGSDHKNAGTEAVWGVTDPGTARNHERLGALEGQNIEGLIVHRMMFNKKIVEAAGYKELFDKAFPGWDDSTRYSRKAASFALSAYLRSITTDQAPFQKWLKGDYSAMSNQEKEGAKLFFGKANCVSCHFEKNLGSMTFAALGVDDIFEHGGLKTSINDARNRGRGGFTLKDEDLFKFRTPQLYNLGDTGPYFHGGSKETLRDVVEYFNKGIPENERVPKEQLHPFLSPLNLSPQEVDQLTAFLTNGLRDPNLLRYKPESVISGLCFPNNDPLSKFDMNCN